MKSRACIFVFLLGVVFFIAACTHSQLYDKVTRESQKSAAEVAQLRATDRAKVSGDSGYYADTTPYLSKALPDWASQRIRLVGTGTLKSFVSSILQGTSVNAVYEANIDANKPVTLNFSGTVYQALVLLREKSGYFFDIHKSIISWSALQVKTFQIAFMPGSMNYNMGFSQSNISSSGTSDPSSAGSSATASTGTSNSSGGSSSAGAGSGQYSTLQGSLSVWQDVAKTIKQLLSPEGTMTVAEATSSVIIKDHPSNIATIAQYVKQLNDSLEREVVIKVTVLDVTLNDQNAEGIDWTLVGHGFHGVVGAGVQDLVQLAGVSGVPPTFAGKLTSGNYKGTNLLITALKQQGHVTVTTEPTAVTLNNQVAQIELTKTTGYLQEQSVTVAGGVSGATTSALVPGTVVSGLKLYLLPKILGNNILLQISTTLSVLEGFDTISSGGTNATTIQVPTIDTKHFNQRSEVSSGTTLILAGFKQITHGNKNAAMLNLPVGSNAALSSRSETVVLITPIILNPDKTVGDF